jgi:Lipase (class 3)
MRSPVGLCAKTIGKGEATVAGSIDRGVQRVTPVDSTALIARLRAAEALEFQRHLVPLREAAIWTQPQPPAIDPAFAQPVDGARTSLGETRSLALLAADTYRANPSPPPEYRVARAEDLDRLGLTAQDLSSPVSAFRARVYVHNESGDAVVAFRGSATPNDWRANVRQGAGLPTDLYARALRIGAALARNPDARVTLTGHSLGGGLASAAALASGRTASTFNAAGLSPQTIQRADQIRQSAATSRAAEVSAFHVRGEILTAIQEGGDRLIGALLGGAAGAALLDAPPAFGRQIPIDPVVPPGVRDGPVARHGINFVTHSLGTH